MRSLRGREVDLARAAEAAWRRGRTASDEASLVAVVSRNRFPRDLLRMQDQQNTRTNISSHCGTYQVCSLSTGCVTWHPGSPPAHSRSSRGGAARAKDSDS